MKVRSYSDFLALAQSALTRAASEVPAQRTAATALISQLRQHFPAARPIPEHYAKLADMLKAWGARGAEQLVRSSAHDYWLNVEGGRSSQTSVVAASVGPAPVIAAPDLNRNYKIAGGILAVSLLVAGGLVVWKRR
jgi:hypothetical protein